MSLRVLALLPEAHGARACLDAALAAAVAPDAVVEAFHVEVDPDRLLRAPEEIAIQHLRERDEGTAAEREAAVRAVYDGWLADLPPEERARVRWRERVGAEDELVAKEATGASLLVLARPQDMDAGDAFHAAIFQAHHPLLVPPDWTRETGAGLAGRIAVAWRPDERARRAIEQARPWLAAARSVVILLVAEHEDQEDAPDTLEIDMILADMGVRPECMVRSAEGRDPGEVLLEMVAQSGADALVMGAYRHNEWVEWALGGTTRHVLAHARVPLILAH